jgi:hypothetical protein
MARPIRTFLDSGVLIGAYKGSPWIEAPANNILDDPNRVFLSSPMTLGKASGMDLALAWGAARMRSRRTEAAHSARFTAPVVLGDAAGNRPPA